MFTSPSKHSNNSQDTPFPSTTGVGVILLLVPVWILLAWLLMIVQEIWFDPWDALTLPAEGTTPASWHPLVTGPLFAAFVAFVLGGNVGLAGWKLSVSAEKRITIHRIAKAQLAGLLLFMCLIGLSMLSVADLWSEVPLATYQQYVNYNHYIRTGPFIALGFLLFGRLFWHMLRIK